MATHLHQIAFILLISSTLFSCRQNSTQNSSPADKPVLAGPQHQLGELFEAVQMNRIFPDSKTFADCVPKASYAAILEAYKQEKEKADFRLEDFVNRYFERPHAYASGFTADTSLSVQQHIKKLWPVLTRQPDVGKVGSLIPLPHPYIVPGGRFGEIYYWDSYFTMLGLEVSDSSSHMIKHMVDNFSFLIDSVGFIPNGNRTYYLGRSQPPFYAVMLKLLVGIEGPETLPRYLSPLEKEYQFWMDGKDEASRSGASLHVVKMGQGVYLNRYWDKFAGTTPGGF